MKSFGKIMDLLIVFVAIEFIPRIATRLTDLLNPLIMSLDKDRVFLWISVHHIVQLILTLIIMKLYFNSRLADWGFNLNDKRHAVKIVGWFAVIFFAVQMTGAVIVHISRGGTAPYFGYARTLKNILGYYGFEGLISGTCEEPLFRGFVITVLAQSWKGKIKIGKIDFSAAVIIAAVLFTYAHISFTLFPFRILHLSPLQLITAFCLSVLNGVVFQKTKSLFIPVLLHNVSNIIVITSPYILLLI